MYPIAAKVQWYFDGTKQTDHFLLYAKNLTDAMAIVEKYCDEIESVEVTYIGTEDSLFELGKETYERLLNGADII